MAVRRVFTGSAYGLRNPVQKESPIPIKANRAPSVNDTAPLGTLWLDQAGDKGYALVTVTSSGALWVLLGNSGGAANFTTLTTSGSTSLGNGNLVVGTGAAGVSVATTSVSSATTTVINNARNGRAVYTGQTTAAAASVVLTLSNSLVTATSAILMTVNNLGANDAQMTLTRVLPSAGSIAITLKNNGAAALNGSIQITYWILN